jgi:hypothetical protein
MDNFREGIKAMPCPYCGYSIDSAADVQASAMRPRPGDFSVCFGCAGVLVFDAEGGLRLPTEAERAEADTSSEVIHAMVMVDHARSRRDS